MTGQVKGDLLIQVTTWAGLTAYSSYKYIFVYNKKTKIISMTTNTFNSKI